MEVCHSTYYRMTTWMPSCGKVFAWAIATVLSTLPRMGTRGLSTSGHTLPWYSDAAEMELEHGERAHRLVFLELDTDEVWTSEARGGVFRIMTQEGIFPTQVRAPPSAIDGEQALAPCPLSIPIHGLGGGERDPVVGAGLPAADRGSQVHGTPIE